MDCISNKWTPWEIGAFCSCSYFSNFFDWYRVCSLNLKLLFCCFESKSCLWHSLLSFQCSLFILCDCGFSFARSLTKRELVIGVQRSFLAGRGWGLGFYRSLISLINIFWFHIFFSSLFRSLFYSKWTWYSKSFWPLAS